MGRGSARRGAPRGRLAAACGARRGAARRAAGGRLAAACGARRRAARRLGETGGRLRRAAGGRLAAACGARGGMEGTGGTGRGREGRGGEGRGGAGKRRGVCYGLIRWLRRLHDVGRLRRAARRGLKVTAPLLAAARMEFCCRARRAGDSEARKNSIMPGFAPKKWSARRMADRERRERRRRRGSLSSVISPRCRYRQSCQGRR